MENYFDWEKAKAFVYLLTDGDDSNKVAVTDELLMVIYRNQKSSFSLNQIIKIKIEIKKMLFPLIVGGIITPFAFLSYFTNLFMPWIHLISMLAGMFLLYTGWVGKSSFTIILKKGDEENFYLSSISPNLRAFMDYINGLLSTATDKGLRSFLFFEIERKHEDTIFDDSSSVENLSIFPVFGYTFSQWGKDKNVMKKRNIIVIDPLLAGTEIKFSFDQQIKQMRPRINHPISITSKVDISDFY